MTETSQFETPSALAVWVSASRPRTLPAAIAPVLAASALAWHDGVFQLLPAVACAVFALLIQIGTNFANDYYDYIKGADTAERVGPKRAVAAGWVKPRVMMAAMVIVFALAFACGLTLLRFGGWPLLVIGVTSIISGIAYTGGPYPLGYNGLGDLFVFGFFGLVAVCATYFVQAGQMHPAVVVIACGIGFLTTNILVVNNYRDVETDAKAGKRTLVVRFGRGFARAQYVLSIVAALLVPVVLIALGFKPWVLLTWGIAPLAARHVRRLKTSTTPREQIALLGDTGKLLALYAISLSAGLVLGRA
ncbi:MAG TPA: 1,4-dihydroxy-2-naphthoate polyprenyltransferase [Opitutaceae bacterium]|nr:1,4-dihydroxy-2-naphthoate polyprenyltransferase [Opitutaceae bacterium]